MQTLSPVADHDLGETRVPMVKTHDEPATARDFERLTHLIQSQEWVKGAVNYDEDLHFSTYYLRASCATQTSRLYPGYSTLIAHYDGFNEHYYLLKQECLETAQAIVQKAIRRPAWLAQVVQKIGKLSEQLTRVFHPQTSAEKLARLSDAELLALYRRHDKQQRALYLFARLPEALDRGVSYFSNYLLAHLRQLGLSIEDADETFSILSQPVVPSVLAQEMLDFEKIVVSARVAQQSLTHVSARTRMFVAPQIVQSLRAHHEQWKYLPYHGYGRREPTTLGQLMERLGKCLSQPAVLNSHVDNQYVAAAEARKTSLEKLGLDLAHRALFEVYPEIGAAKLHRRYAQLRNFYFLDMLLAEISRRFDATEWTVRCMLPEEVMSHLESPRPIPSAIQERGDGCLYTILNDEEQIVTGSQAQALRHFLQAKLHPVSTDNVLRGHVACRGKVVGRCRVVIRADDLRDDFEPGSIVVSESTDPDLIGILKKAGGVLTEQGGVTSHAAIICRELNVPTIIGIEGLLERIQDGQLVEIDADRGLVTLLQSETKLSDDLVFSPGAGNTSDIIGAKAYNLGLVRSHGFAVPDFVLFKYDGLRRELDQNHDRNGTHLTAWTVERLGLSPDDKLAIRSSAVDEDRENGSLAGEYHSLLHVGPKFFLTSLYEFLAKNQQGQRETAYRGSIIVQRMIEPTYSGVCLTLDPRTGNRNGVIIEFVTGGNEGVTGGQVRPERLVIDRLTGDILEDERRDECESRLDVDVTALVRQFLTLESHFGKPLDIEWALVDRKLYILQARPIVHLVGETSGLN